MAVIDASTDFGRAVSNRLENETLIWLTTIGKNGAPHPKPVWFLWENGTILIYSQPNTAKLRHIARDGQVALNFNSNAGGGDIAVINGTAEILEGAPPASDNSAYVSKYAAGFTELGMNPESFAASYRVAIRVTPEKLWGF